MDYIKLGLDPSLIDAVKEVVSEARVITKKYSWGTMKTVEHGHDFSIPLHPEHHQAIAKLKDEQEHKFKDETGRHWVARRKGDKVHFNTTGNGSLKTHVPFDTMKEEVEHIDELIDYSKMSVQTLNKHLTNHKLKYAQTKNSKHLSQIGTIKDVIQGKLKEETELTLEDFSLKELEEFVQTEKYEQLDELSKKTLGNYIKKASKDYLSTNAVDSNKSEVKIGKNRLSGINKAVNKLTKEQMEEIEALAAKHGLTEE